MMELIQKGGSVMWVLLVLSGLGATVFLQRLFHLHRAQITGSDFLKGIFTILQRGNTVEAVAQCEETPGPIAEMTRAAILSKDEGPERMQQVMKEVGLAEITRLEKNLTILLTIAQLSPMLGLLGTLIGMVDMLGVIHDRAPLVLASDLGGGLAKALLTTIVGLTLAIPMYGFYNLLVSRVESIVVDMERAYAELCVFFARTPSQESAP